MEQFFFPLNTILFLSFKPIKGGEGAKRPPTSFSPVSSANEGINPQDFLNFSVNPLALPG